MLGGGRPTSANQLKPLTEAQRAEAIRGVSGMMYFADFNNPILLEALGDLLISGDLRSNAAHLAGLCYIHASMVAADAGEQQRLR